MIHSARPTVSLVVNIDLLEICFVLKSADRLHIQKQLTLPAMTVGWPGESI